MLVAYGLLAVLGTGLHALLPDDGCVRTRAVCGRIGEEKTSPAAGQRSGGEPDPSTSDGCPICKAVGKPSLASPPWHSGSVARVVPFLPGEPPAVVCASTLVVHPARGPPQGFSSSPAA